MTPAPATRRAFEGKTVLLTGAGSGIGMALALRLLECGAKVHAADMNAAGLDSLAAEAKADGKLVPRVLDVTNRED